MSDARAYYNENDKAACAILHQLISEGVIAPGDVDDRSIKDVTTDDIRGYTQVHWFAGGGLWSVAARMAGWPDARPLWTASCPCQPYSAAGKRLGEDDPRNLWPDLFRIIRCARAQGFGPSVLVGEQVSGAPGDDWFDGVRADLAIEDYASRVRDFPAGAVDSPQQRNRLYWIAVANTLGDAASHRNSGALSWQRSSIEFERPDDGAMANGQSSGFGPGLRQGGALEHGAIAANGDDGSGAGPLAGTEGQRGGRDLTRRRSKGRAAVGSPDAGSGPVVDASILGRREGSAQSGILGRRPAPASADVRDMGSTAGQGQQGLAHPRGLAGGSPRRPDAQRADGGDGGHGVMADSASLNGSPGRPGETHRPQGSDDQEARPLSRSEPDDAHGRGLADGDGRSERRRHREEGEPQICAEGEAQGYHGQWHGIRNGRAHAGGRNGTYWSDAEWITCHDNKARRAKPGLRLLVNGLPGRVDLWRVGGNAIVPEAAAEVIAALLEAEEMMR